VRARDWTEMTGHRVTAAARPSQPCTRRCTPPLLLLLLLATASSATAEIRGAEFTDIFDRGRRLSVTMC